MELPTTREACIEADKAFGAIFNAQKTKGHGTTKDVTNSGVKDVLSVIGWLKSQKYITDKYGNAALGQLEANGNPQFVKEWDKRQIEERIKEEKENREWELKMRTEERDKLKVELQESQRNIQKRQLRVSIVSLVVGIILGAGGMWLKHETVNSQPDRNNSDSVNKGQLIIQDVDTLVK